MRVNQILEDMLRAYAQQYGRSWDKSLPYVEFSYNNNYQDSLKMAPFEMLYGHRCRTPLFWSETGERKVFGPGILQEAEKQVRMVRESLRVTQSKKKSYPHHRRRELSFEVGDFVYLKVSPMRGLRHFKLRGKLALRFIGPFKILGKRGEVAYQLELSPQLSDVHDVFHVSQLKNICVCLKSKSPWKTRMLKIFPIKSTLSRFWRHSKEQPETRGSKCARYNGATIPKKKLHGKEKKS
jgi:hypothetical protein